MSTPLLSQPARPRDPLMRIDDVAEYTGIPVSTWRTWRQRGHGPQAARLGAALVWRQSQIDAWLDEQFAKAAAGTK